MTPALHDEIERLESRIGPVRAAQLAALIGINDEIERQKGRREILDAVNNLFAIPDRRTESRGQDRRGA